MPIRRELRKHYGREWLNEVRPRILARAGNRCEQCGVANHVCVERRYDCRGRMFWRATDSEEWRDHNGRLLTPPRFYAREHSLEVVLTIAHLNHTPGDDRDENLKALCQWCHLNYDKLHHHETRASRKDASRPLLQEAV